MTRLAQTGLGLSLVLACALAPASTLAQDASAPSAVVLVYDGADETGLDVDRIRARLATEVGTVVRVAVPPTASGTTLHVRVERGARVVLVLTRGDGSRMERTAELPDEADERAETLAILAVNMFRDESAELLAMLRPAVPVGDGPPPTVDGPRVAPPTIERATDLADASVSASAPPRPPRDPFLRVGLAGHLGSISHGSSVEPDFIAGLELSWTPLPFLAIGARDIGAGGTLQGGASHFDGAPFVELGFTLDFLTLYADLGAHLQVAFESAPGELSWVGVAPFLTAGIRFRLAREVSLGAELAARVVATDSFYTGLYELPQLAVPLTGGLSLLFHIS